MKRRRIVQEVLVFALFTLLYFAAGKLGLRLAFVNASATAVWPPTGIALGGLLVFGRRVWPCIFLGAFLVNITTAGNVETSLGIALGNTLEGLAGAWLVNRFANGRHAFDRAQDVFKFTVLAAMGATMVSPIIGVTTLALGGLAAWSDFGSIWLTWWVGDMSGALVVAPLVITCAANPLSDWNRAKVFECAALLLGLITAGWTIFGALPALQEYPLLFLSTPALVWIAFRFGQRETAIAIFILSAIAVWGTLRGVGPFALRNPHESLLFLQAFLGVIAVMSMTLSAAMSEHRASEQRLDAQQATMRIASESQTFAEALPAIHSGKRTASGARDRDKKGMGEIIRKRAGFARRRSRRHTMCARAPAATTRLPGGERTRRLLSPGSGASRIVRYRRQ